MIKINKQKIRQTLDSMTRRQATFAAMIIGSIMAYPVGIILWVISSNPMSFLEFNKAFALIFAMPNGIVGLLLLMDWIGELIDKWLEEDND